MNMLRYVFLQSWQLLTCSTLAGIVSGLSGAALVAIIGDGLYMGNASVSLAGKFFGLALVYLLSKTAADLSLLHLTQGAVCRLRIDLSHKLLDTPLQALDQLGKHRLQAILTRDVDIFVQAFQLLPMVFSDAVLLLACLGYMAYLSWQVFAVFTVILAVSLVTYYLVERRPARKLVLVRSYIDALYQSLRGLIEGSRELKLNAARRAMFLNEVVGGDARQLKRSFVEAMSGYSWLMNTGAILFYLVIGIILFVLPRWLSPTAATLTTITLVLMYLIRPISEIMGAMPSLQQAAIALRRIEDLDDRLGSATAVCSPLDPFAGTAPLSLDLRALGHRVGNPGDDQQFMLGPLSLQIRQGEVLFVIGGNGSGKTTLGLLLLGLYEPEMGALVLNGVEVNSANREHYRQYFSAVLADFYLFEHVIGPPEMDLGAQAEHYLAAFGLAHKVNVRNGRFSTISLSAGQRRRLALVSAYLEDRPIYLFDEWAADQDPLFKRVFYTEILPALKARGKTVIVISHDDGYFSCADRIVRLIDGQLHAVAPAPTPARSVDPAFSLAHEPQYP